MHGIRMGTHAEKEYLQRAAPWYDEVLLNANLVEGTSGASAAFVAAINKPYVVDPVTYAFAQPTHHLISQGRDEVKKTFRGLAERYGSLTLAAIEKRAPLLVEDLDSQTELDSFALSVSEYQRTRLQEAINENEAFLGAATISPARVLAAYFFNDRSLEFLQVNCRLLESSIAAAEDSHPPTWGVIAIDGLLLDQPEQVEKVARAYKDTGAAGFYFWPSAFSETQATLNQIRGLRQLSSILSSDGAETAAFYGGYFSALLKDDGVRGICHGVGYGEKRDITPVVGGGLPPAKYYLRPVHDNVSIDEILLITNSMTEQQFLENICSCTICGGLIAQGGFPRFRAEFAAAEERRYGRGYRTVPTARVYRLSRFHYIENKYLEMQHIGAFSAERLGAQLEESYAMFAPRFVPGRFSYLSRWRDGLNLPIP